MSLINDALKRAKQAQPANLAPADGPTLRPVEPAAHPIKPDYLMFALIAVILLLAGVLALQWFRSGTVTVQDRTIIADTIPAPAVVQRASVASVAAGAPAPTTAAPVSAKPVTAIVAVEPAKVAAPVYRLQSVFYFPKNAWATINGKRVHEGSVVDGARVLAIRQESAMIVTASGQT